MTSERYGYNIYDEELDFESLTVMAYYCPSLNESEEGKLYILRLASIYHEAKKLEEVSAARGIIERSKEW